MKPFLCYIIPFIIVVSACDNPVVDVQQTKETVSILNAQTIIDSAIHYAGMRYLDSSNISFTFRDITYSYKRDGGVYEYQRNQQDSAGNVVVDILNNDTIIRLINGEASFVTPEYQLKYSNSITSVIYFAFLPYKLHDVSANKEYLDTVEINGTSYHKIKVSFKEEHAAGIPEDLFIYWFDIEDYSMDYFAYQYFTDEGGFRFRVAHNQRDFQGLTMQDYHNYKSTQQDIDIEDLDSLYINDQLSLISEINTENLKLR